MYILAVYKVRYFINVLLVLTLSVQLQDINKRIIAVKKIFFSHDCIHEQLHYPDPFFQQRDLVETVYQ